MVKRIKEFPFEEDKRRRLDLSGGVRLDPSGYLEIAPVSGVYPLTPDLFAKTWLAIPRSTAWLGFECECTHFSNVQNQVVTSVGFRVSRDGAEELRWDGAAWVVAAPGEWSTEQELSDNLQNLALSTGLSGLQIVTNLATTDAKFSPRIRRLKVLYETDTEQLEDSVVRGLVRYLKAGVRPVSRADLESDGTASVLIETEARYQIKDIAAVYNLTQDPNEFQNLLSSFDEGARVVTLTAAQTLGERLRVHFRYQPQFSIMRSQDYIELAELPSVVIMGVREVLAREITCSDSVANKGASNAWQLPTGQQIDLAVSLEITTTKEMDAWRLSDELRRQCRANPLLTMPGADEEVRVHVFDEHEGGSGATQEGTHSAKIGIQLMGAVFYDGDASLVALTTTFQTSGSINFQV